MKVPFSKAHGSKNDFLLTRAADAPPRAEWHAFAQAICDRHTGIGADGWLIVQPGDHDSDLAIQLINSDGSDSEMSGNGTRCAAAFLIEGGFTEGEIRIRTGAGLKRLRVLGKNGSEWLFQMNMGRAYYEPEELDARLALSSGDRPVTILNVGNPQCAVFVNDFEFDWRGMGAEIELHPRFPARTNVSFVRVADRNTIDVRFWERGAGETMSSGTGSTGAAFAARLKGLVDTPVSVSTPSGSLHLEMAGEEMLLTGPAEIVATGEFRWRN